jgi:hypothetical protein
MSKAASIQTTAFAERRFFPFDRNLSPRPPGEGYLPAGATFWIRLEPIWAILASRVSAQESCASIVAGRAGPSAK